MSLEFEIAPYAGVGRIAFGLARQEVAAILGTPTSVMSRHVDEIDEQWPTVRVCYAPPAGGVVEIGFTPPAPVSYKGERLFESSRPLEALLRDDPQPYEYVGFLVFMGLGVTVTGLHDDDAAQRAVTVFAKGRWDGLRDKLMVWRPQRA